MASGAKGYQIFKEIRANDLSMVKKTVAACPAAVHHRIPTDANRTPLHVAAQVGNSAVISWLLTNGATIEAVDDFGNTALHLACEKGQLASAKALLQANDVRFITNMTNADGSTALHFAAVNSSRDVAKVLLSCGARADIRDRLGNLPVDLVPKDCTQLSQLLTNQAAHLSPTRATSINRAFLAGSPDNPSASAQRRPGRTPERVSSYGGNKMSTSGMYGAPSRSNSITYGTGAPLPAAIASEAAAKLDALEREAASVAVREVQGRVARLEEFVQAQMELVPEWQKALTMLAKHGGQLEEHEARVGLLEANTRDWRQRLSRCEDLAREHAAERELQGGQERMNAEALETLQRAVKLHHEKLTSIMGEDVSLESLCEQIADVGARLAPHMAMLSDMHARLEAVEALTLRGDAEGGVKDEKSEELRARLDDLAQQVQLQHKLAPELASLVGEVSALSVRLEALSAEGGGVKAMEAQLCSGLEEAAGCLADHSARLAALGEQVAAVQVAVTATLRHEDLPASAAVRRTRNNPAPAGDVGDDTSTADSADGGADSPLGSESSTTPTPLAPVTTPPPAGASALSNVFAVADDIVALKEELSGMRAHAEEEKAQLKAQRDELRADMEAWVAARRAADEELERRRAEADSELKERELRLTALREAALAEEEQRRLSAKLDEQLSNNVVNLQAVHDALAGKVEAMQEQLAALQSSLEEGFRPGGDSTDADSRTVMSPKAGSVRRAGDEHPLTPRIGAVYGAARGAGQAGAVSAAGAPESKMGLRSATSAGAAPQEGGQVEGGAQPKCGPCSIM